MLRRVDDPESRKSLKSLDPPVKPGDDRIIDLPLRRGDYSPFGERALLKNLL
jgi:hypothetical protein